MKLCEPVPPFPTDPGCSLPLGKEGVRCLNQIRNQIPNPLQARGLLQRPTVQPFACVWPCCRKRMGLSPYEASHKCPQLINGAWHINENSSKEQEKLVEMPAGPLTPTHKTKRTFMHTMIFFLASDSDGQAQRKLSPSGQTWVGSVSSRRGKCLLRNRP